MRMVKGLPNAHAATIVAARAERPLPTIDDLWRRAADHLRQLVQLAEADAFRPALGLVRREALWAIKALRDEPLPLFLAAAAREDEPAVEIEEPIIALRPMTAGSEVVEDYGHMGLTLRRHPVAFLRDDLWRQALRPQDQTSPRFCWPPTAGSATTILPPLWQSAVRPFTGPSAASLRAISKPP